ncbi:hypothetical protein Xoosp13_283 [Xanthomonas phage Xoo-sp13]|nr:hypothetical protein Xoosp13_283 [Xanthomonas phage Xoo-sp13]
MSSTSPPNTHLIGRKLAFAYIGLSPLTGDNELGDIFTVVDSGEYPKSDGSTYYGITVVNDRTDVEYPKVDIEDAFFAEEKVNDLPLTESNPWFILLGKPGQEL